MSNESSVKVGGLGFWPLLGLVFITLKLCDVITWSWWWVLLPLYGPLSVVLVIVFLMVFVLGLAATADALGKT